MDQTENEKIAQRVLDFNQVFNGAQGKKVYDFLAGFCLKKECTFDRESARKSDFNAGARAVILEIDYWMEYDVSQLEEIEKTENEEPEKDS